MAKRRDEIKKAMGTGGTEAPARRGKIKDAMRTGREPAQRQAVSGGTPAGGGIGISTGHPAKSAIGIGGAVQPGLGAQLSRRVSEGSITQGRAQKTAGERRTLEDAYGDAWRKRISGGEDLQDLRIQASQGDESAQTALTKAMTRRKNLLAKAQSIGKAMPAVGKQSSRKKPLPPGLKKKTGWSPY